NIQNLEKRDDGKFEILDVKLDNRKTKNLDKIEKNKINVIEKELPQTDQKNSLKINQEMLAKNIKDNNGRRFSMPDRRKGYIQKASIGDHKVYLH